MQIAVVGMGKIGLPLAAQFGCQGHTVVGIDINQTTVDAVNAGVEPFPGEAHLRESLERLVPAGLLRATTDYGDAIPGSDVVVVVVPLFVDDSGEPDFEWMDAATRDIGANLTSGTLICFETTLPVGTTRNRWKPMLEGASGLVEGTDFHVVFSPERVLTGRVFEDLRKYPKLVGALSQAGSERARTFYEAVLTFEERADLLRPNGVWDLGSAEAAELVKLAETTYRDVNIGLANQFALFAQSAGVDIYQVIEAANSQPYSHIHRPGISVGGHCIPIYPQLYLSTDPDATIVRAARQANKAMPEAAVVSLEQAFGDLRNSTVLVLGVAYRGNVKETAFSGAFDLRDALVRRGATVLVHDPLYSDQEIERLGFEPYSDGETIDVAILHTDHAEYAALAVQDFPGVRMIYDGRRTLSSTGSVPLVRLGTPASTAGPGNATGG